MTYGPTWLRSGRLGYIDYTHGTKRAESWTVDFDIPHHNTTSLWTSWTVGRLSPSACNEMKTYEEATFNLNGVTVYWWASNGEETASRCITGRGRPIAITAGAAVASDEMLNTPKSRRHARFLAKAVAYAARFPSR